MSKQYILFDMDGTLTDSRLGIVKSIQYSLTYFGVQVSDLNELTQFVGPSLYDSYINYYKMSPTDAKTAISKYREYYAEKGIFENALYDGIADLLKTLSSSGKTLAVATSKPTFFAEKVLDHFEIRDYFAFISGSELSDAHIDKGDIIQTALENLNISNPNETIMVGDRNVDIFGAKRNNIESIGAIYGYGGRDELEIAGATHLVDNVAELSELLKKIC